jgi:hypothetical protein
VCSFWVVNMTLTYACILCGIWAAKNCWEQGKMGHRFLLWTQLWCTSQNTIQAVFHQQVWSNRRL